MKRKEPNEMKYADLEKLVDDKREELIEAMHHADTMAYLYTSMKYSVALYPDGRIEEREKLAGDDWWIAEDPAALVIGGFCYQYYDILRENTTSRELLKWLKSEMDEIERTEYDRFVADYVGTEEEEPDDRDAVDWIEEDLPDLWMGLKTNAIEELTGQALADKLYNDMIEQELDSARICAEA